MCDGILMKFKLIQDLIVVLIVCKNEEDPFKIVLPGPLADPHEIKGFL